MDPGQRLLRALAVAMALLELLALVVMSHNAALSDRQLVITGAGHLTSAQIRDQAGLGRSQSIFSISPNAVAKRLENSIWIRSVRVSIGLPGRLTVAVQEWQPVATYSRVGGPAWLLSSQGVVLGPAASSTLLAIDGPSGGALKPGQVALDGRRLGAMVQIQRQLPGLIGQQVRSFQLDSCGDLTMVSAKGWTALFGRVLTPDEFASLGAKVAALKAISQYEDYNNPALVYVNVMNPTAVAVHHTTDKAPSPTPTPTANHTPAATIPGVSTACK